MKSVLVLSDLHLKPECKYGLRKSKFELLRFVLASFRQEVDFIVVTGDLEDSSLVDLGLEMEIAETFLSLKEDLPKLIILGGNHETRFQKYVPSDLFAAGAGVTVVKEEPVILDGGILVLRGYSKEPIPDGLGRFFLGHQPVGYKNEQWLETGADDLLKLSYERIILGDIHQRHDVGNKLHSVGTMFPSSFADEGLVGCFGILSYDAQSSEFKRFGTDPSGTYPVFHTINVENAKQDFSPWDIAGNIIKLRVKGTLDENTQGMREQLKDELLAKGARYVQIENLGYSGQASRLPSEILTERELIKERAKAAAWPKEVELEFERRLG